MLEEHCLIDDLIIHHAAAAGMSALDALMSSSPACRQVYPSGGLRVWLQRRAGDPLVPFRQSCRISMPRRRERRRRHRVPRAVCAYGCSDAQEILWPRFRTLCRISLPRWARVPPAQSDHAAHIDAFKAVIGCMEIIAKDPPWHQRILRHSESAR